MSILSMNSKAPFTVPGHPGTWAEIDRRSGFRMVVSVEHGNSVPYLVLNQDGRVVLETYDTLADVLNTLIGPARAAYGYAVANRKRRVGLIARLRGRA